MSELTTNNKVTVRLFDNGSASFEGLEGKSEQEIHKIKTLATQAFQTIKEKTGSRLFNGRTKIEIDLNNNNIKYDISGLRRINYLHGTATTGKYRGSIRAQNIFNSKSWKFDSTDPHLKYSEESFYRERTGRIRRV